MAIKFPLEMRDGVQVRNITDFKKNFDVEKVVGYFLNGKLLTWLEARYYEEEAEAISKLNSDDSELAKKLCKIFDVEYEYEDEIDAEEILRRNERMAKLKQCTDDDEILSNLDMVAFNQEELAELYDKGIKRVYLCEGEFFIPKSKQNLEYILIGEPIVKGLKYDNKKPLNDKNKCVKQTTSTISRKYNEDYIFDKLADVIGQSSYVVTDDYVVFSGNSNNLLSINTDENYIEDPKYFRVWDIKREKLSSFKLMGYESYSELIASTGNKIVLKKFLDGNDVLVYDIENQKAELTCENWGREKPFAPSMRDESISVCNGKIAYVDENKNLYYVDLHSYEKVFVENLDGVGNKIFLNEDSLIYAKEDKIFHYDFFDKQKKEIKNYIKDSDAKIEELMLQEDKLYIIETNSKTDSFRIIEMDLKKSEKSLNEVFKTEIYGWHYTLVRKDPYCILLKEESGFPVYAFNARLGIVKKILSNCGYTESETHWFAATDYFYYGYSFWVVGNYFFYNKAKYWSGDENYFRLNMLTGEHVEWKKKK